MERDGQFSQRDCSMLHAVSEAFAMLSGRNATSRSMNEKLSLAGCQEIKQNVQYRTPGIPEGDALLPQ